MRSISASIRNAGAVSATPEVKQLPSSLAPSSDVAFDLNQREIDNLEHDIHVVARKYNETKLIANKKQIEFENLKVASIVFILFYFYLD